MKLRFIFLGKKNTSFLDLLIKEYFKRLNKYVKSEYIFIDEKNSVKLEQKIIKQVKSRDYMIVLDEKGQTFTTVEYAKFLKKTLINSIAGARYQGLNLIGPLWREARSCRGEGKATVKG